MQNTFQERKYRHSLRHQLYCIMVALIAFGQSKHLVKQLGTTLNAIFSFSTYHTYTRWGKRFIDWLKSNHPSQRSLRRAQPLVTDWLQTLVDEGKSAWTIALASSAMCKIYQIPLNDPNRFHPPTRLRQNIKRSRNAVAIDELFPLEKFWFLVEFARATGMRRNVLERVRTGDLWPRDRILADIERLRATPELSSADTRHLAVLHEAIEYFPDYEFFVYHRRDKGGRSRLAPIIGPYIDEIVVLFYTTPEGKLLFPKVPSTMDVHSYRAEYATDIYRSHARKIADIPFDGVRASGRIYQTDVYRCRGDQKGIVLDRAAMKITAVALGHNRICVVSYSYIRDI